MAVDKLIYQLYDRNIEDLLPITKVQSYYDVTRYSKQGYVTLPFENFKEVFPDIQENYIKHLYYEPSAFNEILYYDLNNMLLFSTRIFIINNKFEDMTIRNKQANEKIKQIIFEFKQIYEDHNFSALHLMIPEAYQIEFINKILYKIADEHKYTLFLKFYCNVDYGTHKLTMETLKTIWKSKSESQLKDTMKELDNISSDDSLHVYRGIGDKSITTAYSFTLSHDIARFFAFRLSNSANSVGIVEGTIKKSDVIAYITNRNENEIIALPENIDRKCYTEYYSIDSFMNKEILITFTTQKEFFLYTLDQLSIKLKKSQRDDQHMLRVLLLTIIMAEYYKIKEQYLSTLYIAAMFHDIGRDNNSKDEKHGSNGYKLICQINQKLKHNSLLEKLMTYHCKPDEQALKDDCFINDDEMQLYMILKDADALDRQRFGLKHLKIKYLRLDFARELLFAAFQLIDYKM